MEQESHRRVSYAAWKALIAAANDFDQLHRLMVEYLAEWDRADLQQLPDGLSNPVLRGAEEIVDRALLATRAELDAEPEAARTGLLKDMALTFSAAATKYRRLQAGSRFLVVSTKQA